MNCYICGAGKAEDRCVRCKRNICATHRTYIERRVVCEFCSADIGELEKLIHSLEKEAVQAKTAITSLESARAAIGAGDYDRMIKKKVRYCFIPAVLIVVIFLALQLGAHVKLSVLHYFLGAVVAAAATLFWFIFCYVQTIAAYPAQRSALDQETAKANKLLADLENTRRQNEQLLRQKVAEIARLTFE